MNSNGECGKGRYNVYVVKVIVKEVIYTPTY